MLLPNAYLDVVDRALAEDPHLAQGLNVRAGQITHEAVERALRA